jgi:transcriptional regulator with XRE-family HTH domain
MDSTQPRGKTTRELTIGRKLRELREQRHLTQQDMACRAGVPRTYISRIENARLLPGPLMLGRIATALDVAILELLPHGKNGNGHSAIEAGAFWEDLVQNFSLLSPEEMSRVMFFARSMADQNEQGALVPELAAS